MPSVSVSNARICWWSDGLQLKRVSTKEACRQDMEETRDDAGPAEQGPSNATWWSSDFIEKFGSVSLGSQEESFSHGESPKTFEQVGLSSRTASQVLWSTGCFLSQFQTASILSFR
ncbi:hypothetical protein GQ457_08G021790 [Hibiscus cannabinus]